MSHISEISAEGMAPAQMSGGGFYRRRVKRWIDLALILMAAPFVLPLVLLLALFDTLVAPGRTAASLLAAFVAGALGGAAGSLVTGRWLTSL